MGFNRVLVRSAWFASSLKVHRWSQVKGTYLRVGQRLLLVKQVFSLYLALCELQLGLKLLKIKRICLRQLVVQLSHLGFDRIETVSHLLTEPVSNVGDSLGAVALRCFFCETRIGFAGSPDEEAARIGRVH